MTLLPRCCQGACGLWMIVGGVSWTGIHFAGAVAGGRGGRGGERREEDHTNHNFIGFNLHCLITEKGRVNLLKCCGFHRKGICTKTKNK